MIEQEIENALIEKLTDLKYTYRPDIRDRAALERNFRQHFSELNQVQLSDGEFQRLLDEIVTDDVFTASKRLREKNHFARDDGSPLYYTLVNIKDWCKNRFEVVHQLRMNTHSSYHRYDVLLLINGVPVVQIELKTLGISPRRAMEQIVEYKNDLGNGYTRTLLCFLQLFIVSNRQDTLYFANNNARHFRFQADERFLPVYRHADVDNRKIVQLDEFAERFLAKCTLGETISRYMVLVETEQKLLMMRPYQIYAVQAIVECIHRHCGNGYIWHTTGSGKTLTSFKAATLLKDNPDIDKCLFVVDRKDLDKQTRDEFNRFQKGCVEENTHTGKLVERLLSEDYADKVIVTTIQKLGLALDGNHRKHYREQLEPLRNKRIVFIFDECHRSQFGENHRAIKEFFPNAQLFGFTGTPIFAENASYLQIEGEKASLKTTQDIFEHELHAYTITHAIEDQTVLRFHIDYYQPDPAQGTKPKAGEGIPKRAIVEAILAKHDAATNQRKFNALFATASINDAIEYYRLFQSIQSEKSSDPDFRPLHIACVFSPPAESNPDARQLQEDLPQEKQDNQQAPEEKKAALTAIIADYNARYGTNHDLYNFDLYYLNIQKRIKEQEYPNSDVPHKDKIDLTIVVDMLLTGFDSKYLNTLYVDKNLKYHGLIQAFSRTNRVLNDTKPYGNILDFRQQQAAVDEAITLFSGKSEKSPKEIWLVEKAPVVIQKLQECRKKLDYYLLSQGLEPKPDAIPNLQGDAARLQFITMFKEVQRLKTQLDQYTDLTPADKEVIDQVLPKEELQGFRGAYLDTAQRLREKQPKEPDPTDPVQQLDLELVLFASTVIDYDYIMRLLAKYSEQTPEQQKLSKGELIGLIQSDAKFLDDREEIAEYINTLELGKALDEQAIRKGFMRFKQQKQEQQLVAIAEQHGIEATALKGFVDHILRRMIFDGEQLNELLAPLQLGWRARTQKELALMEELIPLLKKLAQGREIAGLQAYEQ